MAGMEIRMERLMELGQALRGLRDPQEIRRAALDWAIRQGGAASGAILIRESGAWRCVVAQGDPAFWLREWTLPPTGSRWEQIADSAWLLPLVEKEPLEWLGLRDPSPETFQDTAGWEAARLLIAMALEAAREREARGAFFSTAVHELRLPMTSIKGYTDLLRKGLAGPLTETQQRFLETIRANIDRLAALVNDLLEHSRMETGRLPVSYTHLTLPTNREV